MIVEEGPNWEIVSDTGEKVAKICVPANETILQAKDLLARLCNIRLEMIQLFHGNRTLLDSDIVSTVADGAVVTMLRQAKKKSVHVPGDFSSITKAIQALPESGGGIEVLGEDSGFVEPLIYIDRPNVYLYHPDQMPVLNLPKHIVVLKNAKRFRMSNIEASFVSDPFGNLVMDEGQAHDDLKSLPNLTTMIEAHAVYQSSSGLSSCSNPQEKSPPSSENSQTPNPPVHLRTPCEPVFPSDCSNVGRSSRRGFEESVQLVMSFTGASEGRATKALQAAGGDTHLAASRILDRRSSMRKVLASAPNPLIKVEPSTPKTAYVPDDAIQTIQGKGTGRPLRKSKSTSPMVGYIFALVACCAKRMCSVFA